MRMRIRVIVASVACATTLACVAQPAQAESAAHLVSETLRGQTAAERSSCGGVRRTIAAGTNAALVVRTAVELVYNSCQVLRCALETGDASPTDKEALCEQVIRGAVSAGVKPDVISRCSADACDPAAVAATLAATLLEPNYCYFSPLESGPAPPTLPPDEPIVPRDYPRPQASPYSF